MSSHGTDDTRRSECDKFTNDVPAPPSLDFLLGILAIVAGPLGAGYEVDGGDGDAVDGGIRTDDGPPDGGDRRGHPLLADGVGRGMGLTGGPFVAEQAVSRRQPWCWSDHPKPPGSRYSQQTWLALLIGGTLRRTSSSFHRRRSER